MDTNSRGQRTHRAEAELARFSDRQHGAFARRQAVESGLTISQIDYRLRSQRWVVIDHNVYRAKSTPTSWKQRVMAACLAGPAVASHRSAGILWEFPAMPKEIVEVTALRHRRRRSTAVIWHESFHLTERDVTELDGIPVTRPVRTFLDLAVVLDPAPLEEVLNDGIHRNLLSIPAVWRRWEQLGPLRRGAGMVRALLEYHTADERPTESKLETLFFQLLRDAGLPTPTKQVDIPSVGRVDFAYSALKVVIELDSRRYHSSWEARERDLHRDNQLVALRWRVLRFTWADVTERPDRVLSLMRALTATIHVNERIEKEGA